MISLKKSSAFFNTGLIALLIIIASMLNCPTSGAESGATPPESQMPASQETKTAATPWQKFAGTWEGDNDYSVMRLALTVNDSDKTIYGSHKALGKEGKMIDMVGEDTMSINGFFLNDTTAEVSYVGGYNPTDRGIGTALITIVDDNTINWRTTYRSGTSYIPHEMELKKVSQTAVEAKHILFKNAWSVFDVKTKKQFALKSPLKNVTDALGAPKAKTVFLGGGAQSGEIYTYDGLEILAEKDADGDIVSYIHINSGQFITPGNLKVGDTAEKMISLYGAIEKNRRTKEGAVEWYTYIIDTKNGFKSSFAVEGGVIKSIRLSTPIGWSGKQKTGVKIDLLN